MSRLFVAASLVLLNVLSVFGRGGGGGGAGGGGAGGGGYGGAVHYLSYGRGGGGAGIPIIGNGAWAFWLIVFILVGSIGFFVVRKVRRQSKRSKTRSLLKHLMTIDPIWEERQLMEHVESSFLKIQQAWCAQDLETLDAMLTPLLFRDWRKKIRRARKRGHRDAMADTKILRCNVINVQDYLNDELDNFTVELHVFSNDWTLDRDEKILDKRDPLFTEFWTYRRKGNDWLLHQVRQQSEGKDVLKPNVVETA